MRAFVTGGSGFVGGALIRALVAAGHEVSALARSAAAEDTVRRAGATPVRGDLDDHGALARGLAGCEQVFHAAAKVEDWGARADFLRVNVEGTRNVLEAARRAGARRFVHIGTEAAFVDGGPLAGLDETTPLPTRWVGLYPETNALADKLVAIGSDERLAAMVVRPRFIWGRGDTSLLPKIAAAARAGSLRWIGGGRHATSTCHVDNVCCGALLAAARGTPGAAYFLTDGDPVETRAFVSALLRSAGVVPPDKTIPLWTARAGAWAAEAWWRLVRKAGAPPVTRSAVQLFGREVTVSDARARRELGYQPVTSIHDGLVALGLTPEDAARAAERPAARPRD